MIVRSRLIRIASTAIFALAALAHADTPPTRAARLTLAQGTVTLTQPDNSTPIPAQPNLPLLSGVQISTGPDGTAEIEFEDGSLVRLTPNTALSLDSLAIGSDGIFVTDLSLLHGLVYTELRATPQYSFTLNAGGDILSPIENTTVRITFDQPPAVFAVLDGTAEIDRQPQPAAGYQTQLHAGESLQSDPEDPTRYFLTQQITPDSWDQWNDDLDQQAAAQSADTTSVRNTYAGPDGYGWSDLDANGSWYNVPGEGPVWQPQVADTDPDFDPYGSGAWVYYPATGYIWASSYSWGWTPYRCGTWSYYNSFGWGWAPGSTCGAPGWGFAGAGGIVNINRIPRGYHPIRVPRPRPGPLPPILPINRQDTTHPGQPPSASHQHGPRSIDGVAVSPILPSHTEPGSAPVRSSLRRDYPTNPTTHAPILGLTNSPTTPHNFHLPPPANEEPSTSGTPSAETPRPQHSNPTNSSTNPSPDPNRSLPATYPDEHRWPESHPSGQPTTQPGSHSQLNEPSPASQRPEHLAPPQDRHPEHSAPPPEQHPEHAAPPQQPHFSEPPHQEFHPPPPPPHQENAPPPPRSSK